MHRNYFAAFALYLLIAVIVTFPLITNLSTDMAGFVHSDAHEMAHHLWWFTYAARNGEPLFRQTLMGYPDGIDGTIIWAVPLQFFPAWLFAFVIGIPAAYNMTILLTMAGNGLAMFALVRYLVRVRPHPPAPSPWGEGEKKADAMRNVSTGYSAAAFIAGVVFMLYPTMQGHLGAGHAGLLVQWTLPLYTLAILRLSEGEGIESGRGVPRPYGKIVLAAFLFVTTGWGHTLQVLYATVPLTGVVLLWLLIRREWGGFRRVLIASAIGAVGFGLFILPVIGVSLGTSAITGEGGFVRYSADLLAPVTPSFFHPLYGSMEYTHRVLGVNLDEGAAYVGIVGGALALIGVVRQRGARLWLVIALLAFVLSLGPVLKIFDQPITFTTDGYASAVTLPFAYVADIPGISLARTPGRFNFVLALSVAVMAGYGAATLFQGFRIAARTRRAGTLLITALLAALIAFDYQTFFPLPTVTVVAPDAVRALSTRDDIRAVFDIPYDNLVTAKNGLFLQTAHERPIIAGQLTRRTPVNPAKLAILEATLDPALLREAGADVVIVHRPEDGDGTLFNRASEQLGEPVYVDAAYAIFETPPTDVAPGFMALYDTPEQLTSNLVISVYTPQPVGALLTAALAADGRDVIVRLNEQRVPIARWTINGSAEATVFIGLDSGYHTVTLSLDPPCLTPLTPSLVCRAVTVERLTLEADSD